VCFHFITLLHAGLALHWLIVCSSAFILDDVRIDEPIEIASNNTMKKHNIIVCINCHTLALLRLISRFISPAVL
jgi:hypothetical protein